MTPSNPVTIFLAGAGIGVLGGLIGLGGAEFRLPLLMGLFHFAALEAVILNKTLSMIVVAMALPARADAVSFATVLSHWPIIFTLLPGCMVGAWMGAGWAIRLRAKSLCRVIAVLLFAIAGVLLLGHGAPGQTALLSPGGVIFVGAIAGWGIGLVAAVLGVAGGELLIPTIALLFGADLKLAGSLSLAISLPTLLTAFGRYSRDGSFRVVRTEWRFVLIMAAGSIAGTYLGGRLLGVVESAVLLPLLAAILVISAIKVWRDA